MSPNNCRCTINLERYMARAIEILEGSEITCKDSIFRVWEMCVWHKRKIVWSSLEVSNIIYKIVEVYSVYRGQLFHTTLEEVYHHMSTEVVWFPVNIHV
jgi:hypothetical protein